SRTRKKIEIERNVEGINLTELNKKKEDIQLNLKKIQKLKNFSEFIREKKVLFFFSTMLLSLITSLISLLLNFKLASLFTVAVLAASALLITREYYTRRNRIDKQENVLLSELNIIFQKIDNYRNSKLHRKNNNRHN
ncbi:MAG: hypothetical protein QXP88_03750, partial [Thermoproteota archaeon]